MQDVFKNMSSWRELNICSFIILSSFLLHLSLSGVALRCSVYELVTDWRAQEKASCRAEPLTALLCEQSAITEVF